MPIDYLVHNLWLSLILWTALYFSDYILTLVAARMYQEGVNQHLVFEKGYELTPYFQEDIARLRRVSPKFIRALVLTLLALSLLWLIAVRWDFFPAAFEFLIGGLVLVELAVHFRHFVNLLHFRYARKSQGVRGRIEYARWFSLRLSSLQLCEYAALYLLFYILFPRWFFLGGVFTCLATSLRHWIWSVKERSRVPQKIESSKVLEG